VLIATFHHKHFIALTQILNKTTNKWLRLYQEEKKIVNRPLFHR